MLRQSLRKIKVRWPVHVPKQTLKLFPELRIVHRSLVCRFQLQELRGKLPDAVVACVGGGSNAIGTFFDFIGDKSVRLIGVEAGGEGEDSFFFLTHPQGNAYAML